MQWEHAKLEITYVERRRDQGILLTVYTTDGVEQEDRLWEIDDTIVMLGKAGWELVIVVPDRPEYWFKRPANQGAEALSPISWGK